MSPKYQNQLLKSIYDFNSNSRFSCLLFVIFGILTDTGRNFVDIMYKSGCIELCYMLKYLSMTHKCPRGKNNEKQMYVQWRQGDGYDRAYGIFCC